MKVAAIASILLTGLPLFAQTPGAMSFTVTMEAPASQLFQVAFRVSGLTGEIQDFKIPEWTPGYYRIMNYDRNILNFRAEDAGGHSLAWEKATKNIWRVVTANAPAVTVRYDVRGTRAFAAENLLSENRAFITPPGLFMHVAGKLQQPATVTFKLPANWAHIATGMEPIAGQPNTFTAPDFDTLYDSPILMGNQEALQFEVKGVPHYVAMENVPATVDRVKVLADLKKLVETATRLMGEVPYKRYAFLMMGQGNGGIEHLNSASIAFNGASLTTENGYRGWLSYVSHEYFHNFNVKRIRPLALGPFDYDGENLTDMLWVSEGFTSYYEDILMVRAGLMTRDQYLAKITATIAKYENAPGHRYQSVSDASLSAWGGSGIGGDRNTTVSYYDKGPVIGLMLDLKIRDASRNRQSLDDVMRGLYRKYYQERKRGFTDAEFWQECETAAGAALAELKEYVATTKNVDYAKYFAYAGLSIDTAPAAGKGAYLGINTDAAAGKIEVADVSDGSPAVKAGLKVGDQIAEIEGVKSTLKGLSDLLIAKKPGDKIKLKVIRSGATQEVEVELGVNPQRSFAIQASMNAAALAGDILKDWMRAVQ